MSEHRPKIGEEALISVSMAQMWTVIGIMATAFAAMIGFSHRAMTEQGKALTAQMEGLRQEVTAQLAGSRGEAAAQADGLRGEFNAQMQGLRGEVNAQMQGLRGEVNAQIQGLRSEVQAEIQGLRAEMNARFEHLSLRLDKVESIDREVHALSIKVMGRDQPPEN